jgi:branched-chain amino acid transport system substrate-binding protein
MEYLGRKRRGIEDKMKTKNIWMIVLVIVIVLVVAGSLYINTTRKDNTIKIGAIMPLTGNIAGQGVWSVQGGTVAEEEINSRGGINGKKLETIYEDSKGLSAEGVSAYEKLRNINNIKYVLTSTSSVALSVQKLSENDKVIQMDTTATVPSYSTPDDYSFRTGITATQLSKESADILYNKLNSKKVAVLYMNNDFGKGMAESFKKNYKGEIVLEDTFNVGSTDFKTSLLKLKEKKFDYVFLVSFYGEAIIIMKQAKEIGMDKKFFSNSYSIEVQEFLDKTKGISDGIIYVSPKFDVNSSDPAIINYVKKYKEKYKEEPNFYSAQEYDGVIALSKVLEKCNYDDTECARKELMNLDFQGASGRIKFDSNGDVLKEVELKTIKNGEFVKYEQQ